MRIFSVALLVLEKKEHSEGNTFVVVAAAVVVAVVVFNDTFLKDTELLNNLDYYYLPVC